MYKGKTLGMVKDDVFNKFWFELPKHRRSPAIVKTEAYYDEVARRYAEEVVKDRTKELVSELEQVVKTLENVSTLGNICDLADHAKQLINKHKGGKS